MKTLQITIGDVTYADLRGMHIELDSGARYRVDRYNHAYVWCSNDREKLVCIALRRIIAAW